MSDEEDHINPKSHKQLLQAISSLGKTQHIRKSTRDEHKLVQDGKVMSGRISEENNISLFFYRIPIGQRNRGSGKREDPACGH